MEKMILNLLVGMGFNPDEIKKQAQVMCAEFATMKEQIAAMEKNIALIKKIIDPVILPYGELQPGVDRPLKNDAEIEEFNRQRWTANNE